MYPTKNLEFFLTIQDGMIIIQICISSLIIQNFCSLWFSYFVTERDIDLKFFGNCAERLYIQEKIGNSFEHSERRDHFSNFFFQIKKFLFLFFTTF